MNEMEISYYNHYHLSLSNGKKYDKQLVSIWRYYYAALLHFSSYECTKIMKQQGNSLSLYIPSYLQVATAAYIEYRIVVKSLNFTHSSMQSCKSRN